MKVALFWWLQAQDFYQSIHKDAVELANKRLKEMVITESALLKKGSASYLEKSGWTLLW